MADPATSVIDPLAIVGRPAVIKVTATADFNYTINSPGRILALSLHGQGTFGGGTLSLRGSNDGTNFFALPTAVSMTASGIASVAPADLGYRFYDIQLTGSTTPSITAIVCINLDANG